LWRARLQIVTAETFSHWGVFLNIKLVSPRPEDVHFWLQVRSQKSTQENNPIGVLSTENLRQQISESNLDLTHRKSAHRYYIQTEEGTFAGVISLKDINWNSGVCDLGYLIDEKFQNRGIATQAVALIMQKAFSSGLQKIKATTFTKNIASFKVLQKNGFVLEGTLKNEVLIQGNLEDLYTWAAFAPRTG
jgi:ribosomal-protein-alanine N-acetyltransferase